MNARCRLLFMFSGTKKEIAHTDTTFRRVVRNSRYVMVKNVYEAPYCISIVLPLRLVSSWKGPKYIVIYNDLDQHIRDLG